MFHVPLGSHYSRPKIPHAELAAAETPLLSTEKTDSSSETSVSAASTSLPQKGKPVCTWLLLCLYARAHGSTIRGHQMQSDTPPQCSDPKISFIKVPVKPSDSVMSVAVRHGVSEAELRQYNRGLYIWDYCDFVTHVWIPQKVTLTSAVGAAASTDDTHDRQDSAAWRAVYRCSLRLLGFCGWIESHP